VDEKQLSFLLKIYWKQPDIRVFFDGLFLPQILKLWCGNSGVISSSERGKINLLLF
jgi:hypothetical protein